MKTKNHITIIYLNIYELSIIKHANQVLNFQQKFNTCFVFQVTVKEQQEWRIPPSVSNWKNPKGYTLPLDKRLAADGRGLQSVHINEKFAKLAEALYIADRKAREQVSEGNG